MISNAMMNETTQAVRDVHSVLATGYTDEAVADYYINIAIASPNPDEYVLVYLPSTYEGKGARWTVTNGEQTELWENPDLTLYSDPVVVAEWVKDVICAYTSKVNHSLAA